ncbi:ankyrin repeat domain-containing protein, partial [Phaeovulum sp. NW3]|uniref:ankyrin repeat domain-containing protein n=1 Tax=Phaeovulum sp. NW3 TaxID=2934933 RepID=UPI00201FDEB6
PSHHVRSPLPWSRSYLRVHETGSRPERLFNDAQVFAYKPEVLAPPSTQTVRRLMLFARSLEQGWKDLVAVLTPRVSPHDPDPMRNKALQLAELFRLAFLFTFAAGKGNTKVSDGLFKQAIPEWLQQGPFKSILPNATGQLPRAEEVAATLTERIRLMNPDAELPDVFGDSRMVSAASARPECTIAQVRTQLRTLLQKGYGAWESQSRNRAIEVRKILSRLREHQHADQVKADIHYLAALDALARGDLDDAAVHLKDGLTACAAGNFGWVESALARLSFGLQVSAAPFNRNESEKYFRIFSRALAPDEAQRWRLGQAPLEYTMRLAAVEAAESFPRSCRPYPGVARSHPMQGSVEVFQELAKLMLSGADENAIRVFKRTHKRALKAKLRDVRGDTVFTMLTKMMPNLVRAMQDMTPFDGMRGSNDLPTAAELSDRLRQTYLRFVRQLPVDHLSAQDYLGQTALMFAAEQKDRELTALLLEVGIETDQQDTLGRTALHSSIRSGSSACFELLLDHGANPKIQTCEGKTALVMAAEFGRARFVGRLLSEARAKPEGRELHEAHTLADRNSRNYTSVLAAYREAGVALDCREKFADVVDLLKGRFKRTA